MILFENTSTPQHSSKSIVKRSIVSALLLMLFLTLNFKADAARFNYFAPVAPIDVNNNTNTVAEKAVNGTTVGITAYSNFRNLALNQPVTVSSQTSATNNGAAAVDGSTSTRWESNFSDPQWIYVDLGGSYIINEVKITWESAYGKNFNIQVSDNGTDWTNAQVITGNTTTANDFTGLAATGRYVRIYGTVRGSTYGYSIYELAIYGNPANSTGSSPITYSLTDNAGGRFAIDGRTGVVTLANSSLINYANNTSHSITVQASDGSTTSTQTFTITVVKARAPVDANTATNTVAEGAATGTAVGITAILNSKNVALNQPTTVSSLENSSLVGPNAVDGNSSSRWSSAYSDPSWIYVDLGASYLINEIKITWEAAYGKNFQLQTSSDASTWTDVKVITGNTATTNDYTGLTATGRYVRMYGTVRGTSYGYSIYELEVYGNPASGTGAIAYSLTDDAGGRFKIDATNGVVTVNDGTLLNYQNATTHNITVAATDGVSTFSQTFSIAVTSVNKAPVITSDGGPANGIVYTLTGSTAVTTVLARDPESNTITYSISGGADASAFGISSSTGALTFNTAPTSSSTSAAGSKTYTVIITAADNGSPAKSSSQTLSIILSNGAYDWVGTTSTGGLYYWSTAANWKINGVAATTPPGSSDIARIGVSAYTSGNEPLVTASTSCGMIRFGTTNTPILTVNSGQTLTVNGKILVDHNISTTAAATNKITFIGAGTLNVQNIEVGSYSQLPASGLAAAATTLISSQVNQLIVNQNISLLSTGNGNSGYCYPNFQIDNNTVQLYGQINVTNNGTISSLPGSDPFRARFSLGDPASGSTSTKSSNLTLYNAIPVTLPLISAFGLNINGGGTNSVTYGATSGYQAVLTATDGIIATTNTYGNLTFQGAALKIIDAGNLVINTGWTSTGGAVNLAANNPNITINGSWSNAAVTNFGSGTITFNGNVTNTGTLNLGNGTLNLAGNYTNSNIFTAGAGAVNINGAAAQTLIDNGSGTVFNTVNFSGGNTKTLSSGYFAVSGKGILTMIGSTTLNANGKLTCKSTAAGSATIAAIPSTASITGNINAERFITGSYGRGYRLVSSPTYSSAGFYTIASLIGSTPVTGPNSGSGSFDPSNTNNSSIWIYREGDPFPNSNVIKDSDFKGVYSLTENIPVGTGLLFFNRGNRSTNLSAKLTGPSFPVPEDNAVVFTGGVNQGTITVKVPQNNINNFVGTSPYAKESPGSSIQTGYYYKYNASYPPVSNLLRTNWYGTTGALGDQYTDGYNLIGNPYQATVDLDAVTFGSDLNTKIYTFNPANRRFSYYQKGSAGAVTDGNGATRYISSGQGFFVRVNTAGATDAAVTFNEANKVTSANIPTGSNQILSALPNYDASFTGNKIQSVNGQLIKTSGINTSASAPTAGMLLRIQQDSINYDAIGLYFNSAFLAVADANDAVDNDGMAPKTYLSSYSSDNKRLAINMLPEIYDNMRIRLFVKASTSSVQHFKIAESLNIFPNHRLYLLDHYKKDSVMMDESTTYNFNINLTDTASYGSNRFELVFHADVLAAYKLISFTGELNKQQVDLKWQVINEGNSVVFTVERSTEGGKTFKQIGTIAATGAENYTYTDAEVPAGSVIYRLVQNNNQTIAYSKELDFTVASVAAGQGLSVYPNPASSVISLTAKAALPNQVQLQIISTNGQVFNAGTDASKINVSNLPPGVYVLVVKNGETNKLYGSIKFIKI